VPTEEIRWRLAELDGTAGPERPSPFAEVNANLTDLARWVGISIVAGEGYSSD
jgi:hypothetical protein